MHSSTPARPTPPFSDCHHRSVQRAASDASELTFARQSVHPITGNAIALRNLARAVFQTHGQIAGTPQTQFQVQNGTLLFRGVGHYAHVRSNLNGHWFGTGFMSDGNHYADLTYPDDAIDDYGFSNTFGWATAYKLSPDARIIRDEEAQQLTLEYCCLVAAEAYGVSNDVTRVLYENTHDNGFRAILTGHDAMVDPQTGYHVVYNNRTLIHCSDLTPWAMGLEQPTPAHTQQDHLAPLDYSPPDAVDYSSTREAVRRALKELRA